MKSIFTLCIIVLLFNLSPKLQAQVLDQSQTNTNAGVLYSLTLFENIGQIFTAGKTGALSKITLKLENTTALPVKTTITIFPMATNGLPDVETPLASTTMDILVFFSNIFDFEFNDPAIVTAGKQYAISVTCDEDTYGKLYLSDVSSDYTAGSVWKQNTENSTPDIMPGDLYFQTYVDESALPVNWINNAASRNKNNYVLVQWTVNEHQVSKYIIEKSMDGTNYEAIDSISSLGNGQRTYKYHDKSLIASEKIYYRIQQISLNGIRSYSSVMTVQPAKQAVPAKLYPNPVKSKAWLDVDHALIGTTAAIYDISGKTIRSFNIQTTHSEINLTGLPSGIYILRLENEASIKLIKK